MVGIRKEDGLPYTQLASFLMDIPFKVIIPGDQNRAADGIALRNDRWDDVSEGSCNVMEALVGIAHRMVYMADGMVPKGDNVEQAWFMSMIMNLGISRYDDDYWDEYPYESREGTLEAVERWLNRDIDFNGEGGLFPLSDARNDQAKTEIWYQMNAFLIEMVGKM